MEGLIKIQKVLEKGDVEMSITIEIESIWQPCFKGNGLERLISTKKVVCGLRSMKENKAKKEKKALPIKKPTKLNGSTESCTSKNQEKKKDGISLS